MSNDHTHADVATSLDALLTLKIWRLGDLFERRLEAELEPMGFTVPTFRLIGELMRAPGGLSQRELARRLRVKPPTVSAAVTRLVTAHVVERLPDPDDARAYRVRLASEASLLPGAEVLSRIEADILSDMSTHEQRHVSSVLDTLLARFHPDPEAQP